MTIQLNKDGSGTAQGPAPITMEGLLRENEILKQRSADNWQKDCREATNELHPPWLIEASGMYYQSTTDSYGGLNQRNWTPNPSDAMQFRREYDASLFISDFLALIEPQPVATKVRL